MKRISLIGAFALPGILTLLSSKVPEVQLPAARVCIAPPADCPSRGECIEVADDVQLSSTCDYRDVEFRFTRSGTPEDPLVFDCSGATIRGGSNVETALALENDEGDPPLQHIIVRNCTINGYKNGIKVVLWLAGETREMIRSNYVAHVHEPQMRASLIDPIESELRSSAPQNIVFDRVHLRGADNVGLYIFHYVHDVTFRRGSSRSTNIGPGIYFDSGSRNNVVENSEIANNGREGIALDSSAYNVIRDNDIHGNGRGGIFLYRNFWEQPDTQLPRSQHSAGNRIIGNRFSGTGAAIWIGYRQSNGRDDDARGDPVYLYRDGTRYYRDNAEGTFISANTFDQGQGIIVHDDGAQITGNRFDGAGSVAIDVGNSIRRQVGEPIRGTVASDNLFHRSISVPIRLGECAPGTVTNNNRVFDDDGQTTPYSPQPVQCNELHASIWLHRGGAGDFEYRSAAHRLPAPFDTDQRWVAGDYNGDGNDDVALIYGTEDDQARVSLHLSTGSGFEERTNFQTMADFVGSGHWLAGDFDGDGNDDLVHLYRGPNDIATAWVHRSMGAEFEFRTSVTRLADFTTSQKWSVGDFNGDGRDDLVNVYGGPNDIATAWVHHSTGGGFENRSSVTRLAGFWTSQKWSVGDFNGDGRDDLVNVYGGPNNVATAWVHHSTGRGFENRSSVTRLAGFWDEQRWVVTDFNGDNRDDLVNIYDADGSARVWRHASSGAGFDYQTGIQTLAGFFTNQRWVTGDFDGDGFGDLLDVYGADVW